MINIILDIILIIIILLFLTCVSTVLILNTVEKYKKKVDLKPTVIVTEELKPEKTEEIKEEVEISKNPFEDLNKLLTGEVTVDEYREL